MKQFNINIYSFILKVLVYTLPILFLQYNTVLADEDLKVEGPISELGSDYIVVQDYKFIINQSTELKGHHGPGLEFSNLFLDQNVEARGNLQSDGSYIATRVKLKDNHDDRNEFELVGNIEELNENSFIVNGFLFYVNNATEMRGRSNTTFLYSDLEVGTKVEIKAFKNNDESYTAVRIKLEDHHNNNQIEITGNISELSENIITIGDMTFIVNSLTVIVRRSNILLEFDELSVGMRVEVKAFRQADGSLVATRIKIEDDDDFNNEIEFTAQIETIENGSITVGGIFFTTNEQTVVLDNNRMPILLTDLQIGMIVEIKGVKKADGSIYATRIKLEDFFRDEIELRGGIEELGANFITVLGKTFLINDQTLVFNHAGVEVEFSILSVGQIVEIKGRVSTTGELVATRIKIEDEEDIEMFGAISALFADHFELAGNTIFVDEKTIVLDHKAQIISYSDLVEGMLVEVKMVKKPDGSFIALRIKVEDNPGFSKISGTVNGAVVGNITIASTNFILSQSTIVLNEKFNKVNDYSITEGTEVILWTKLEKNGDNQVLQLLLKNNSLTGIEENSPLQNNFELKQNYPNPFNPTTTISFTLAKSQTVNLKVYNAIGQEVKNLMSNNLEAGLHNVTFDANGLTSGIYFYKLEIGNNSQVKKMILMK